MRRVMKYPQQDQESEVLKGLIGSKKKLDKPEPADDLKQPIVMLEPPFNS
jgi:hypothetical protein